MIIEKAGLKAVVADSSALSLYRVVLKEDLLKADEEAHIPADTVESERPVDDGLQ